MIIKSSNFMLRPAKKSDLQSWFENYQDEETAKNFMSVPKNMKEAEKELFGKSKNIEDFVIEVDGEAVGSIGVYDIIRGHKATMSFWIAKKCRGRGIMTKAVNLATEYFFKKYKLRRIDGKIRTFNKASARVMEKTGYKLEGILRKNKLKNGKFLDDMVYAKVK